MFDFVVYLSIDTFACVSDFLYAYANEFTIISPDKLAFELCSHFENPDLNASVQVVILRAREIADI